jgi:hypothetical protein
MAALHRRRPHRGDNPGHEFGIVPLQKAALLADPPGTFAGNCSIRLGFPHVKRVANEIPAGSLQRHTHQLHGIARQNRSDRNVRLDSRAVQTPDNMQALGNGAAQRLIPLANLLAVGRYRETDAQRGLAGHFLKQIEVAKNQRASGLDHENLGWHLQNGREYPRHYRLLSLGWLVGIGERRTINHLVGAQFLPKQLRRIHLEGAPPAPLLAIPPLEPGIESQRWHIALRAAERTVTGGRHRMRESGLGDKAASWGKDLLGISLEDFERKGKVFTAPPKCFTPWLARVFS